MNPTSMLYETMENAAASAVGVKAATNAVLDEFYYDTSALSDEERTALLEGVHREGTILIVPPKGAGSIVSVAGPSELRNLAQPPRIYSISGVGSSDLGAAALARNVADALEQPVAAIVSGYGAADLVSEAMGGWFFGMQNLWHRLIDDYFRWCDCMVAASMTMVGQDFHETFDYHRSVSRDDEMLVDILSDPSLPVDLLVGHSKGALAIAESLYELERLGWRPEPFDPSVVTFGAVVSLPPRIHCKRQFLGSWDWLGGINSRVGVDRTLVAHGGHHLNTELPGHLDLVEILRSLRSELRPDYCLHCN